MSGLTDARHDLAQKIAASGLRVTTDVRNVNPPCVVVGLPRAITARSFCWDDVSLEIPVSLVCPPPGNADALDWLLDNLPSVMAAVEGTSAEPDLFAVGEVDLPAYTTIVAMRVAP